jgi:hypothetical protein
MVMATEFFWGAVFQRAMGLLSVEILDGNDQVASCRFRLASAKSKRKEVTRFLKAHTHLGESQHCSPVSHYFVCS